MKFNNLKWVRATQESLSALHEKYMQDIKETTEPVTYISGPTILVMQADKALPGVATLVKLADGKIVLKNAIRGSSSSVEFGYNSYEQYFAEGLFFSKFTTSNHELTIKL